MNMKAAQVSGADKIPGWRRLLGIVVIFAGLGPLIGLAVFGTALAARGLVTGKGTDSLYVIPFFLIYGLLFAHLVGGAYAAAAGLATVWIAWWRGRVAWWMALAVGMASWIAWLYFTRGRVLTAPQPADDIMLETLAVHLLSTLACWRLCVSWLGLRR